MFDAFSRRNRIFGVPDGLGKAFFGEGVAFSTLFMSKKYIGIGALKPYSCSFCETSELI